MAPLNPILFRALQRSFQHVTIANQGLQAVVHHRPNWHRGGKLSAEISGGGEYYRVNCPFCNDTRQRLWFHYLWGTRDEKTNQELLHIASCFNEECIDCRDRQTQLMEMVFAYAREAAIPLKNIASRVNSPEPSQPPIRLPEGRVPINDPHCLEHAKFYLEERGFDLDELWERWGVSYCRNSSDCSPKITDRIVIPVFQPKHRLSTGKKKSVLCGWQARCVGDGSPKYLNAAGMRKSTLLYALLKATYTKGPIVVCEGVTDVWRLGTNAVSLFGKDLSAKQLSLLLRHFEGRSIVVFLDNDAIEKAKKAGKQLETRRRIAGDFAKVVAASLPENRGDIGECSRKEAWEYVARALGRKRGKLPSAKL